MKTKVERKKNHVRIAMMNKYSLRQGGQRPRTSQGGRWVSRERVFGRGNCMCKGLEVGTNLDFQRAVGKPEWLQHSQTELGKW